MIERLILYGIAYGAIAPLIGLIAWRFWPKSHPPRPISGSQFPIIDALALLIIEIALLLTALDTAPVDGDLNWIQTLNFVFGPALHVLRGGIPMVDVFCHYGLLPYLLFSLAFVTAFAPSYQAASLVTAIINAAYIAVAGAILFRALRSKVMAAATIVVLTSFVVPAWMHIPTSGGLRFLPPLLVCFGLILWPNRLAPALVALLVGSFWSLEGFLWSAITFFAALGLRLIYERAPLRKWASTISVAFIALLLAQLAFAATWRVLFGSFPRYDIYLEIVRFQGSYWGDIPFTTPPTWIIFGAIYFGAIALAVAEALRGTINGCKPFLITTVFPVAIAGVAGFSYWVGRPLDFYLMPTVVPAVILAAMAIDRLYPNIWYGTIMGAVVIVFCTVYVVRPGWPHLHERLPRFIRVVTTPTDAAAYDAVIVDAARLIEKYRPPITDRVVLFVRQSRAVPIYLLTGTFDAFGRSTDPVVVSATFMKRFRASVDAIAPGTIIFAEAIIADDAAGRRRPITIIDSFGPDDLEAYMTLSSRYKLCVIEKSPLGMIAAKLEDKAAACP